MTLSHTFQKYTRGQPSTTALSKALKVPTASLLGTLKRRGVRIRWRRLGDALRPELVIIIIRLPQLLRSYTLALGVQLNVHPEQKLSLIQRGRHVGSANKLLTHRDRTMQSRTKF